MGSATASMKNLIAEIFLSYKYSWRPLVLFSRGTTQVWRFLAIFNRGNFVRNLMNSDFSPRSEVYRRRSFCLILLCRYKFETQLDFFNFYDFELPAEVSRSKIAENSAFWYHQYFISSKSDGKLWFMNSCDPEISNTAFKRWNESENGVKMVKWVLTRG